MSPDKQEILWQAGEYVLGTLEPAERDLFERELDTRREAQEALNYWEDRLSSWCLAGAPEDPPHRVWNAIELGLDGEGQAGLLRNFWDNIRFWRPVALSAVAAALILFFLYRPPHQAPIREALPLVAMVGQADQAPRYFMTSHPAKRKLVIQTLRPVSVPPGKSLELWMIPKDRKAPISCGIIPTRGEAVINIPEKDLPFIKAGASLAVSMEPEGGSPTDGPSGPVMYQGQLQKI